MNTEDRIRRASDEIDRVTSTISAPPMAELRRTTRRRGIAVTVATAAAVFVLVGGTVLLLSGRGATTLEPAGPGETTTTAETSVQSVPAEVDGVPVRVPAPGGDTGWRPGDEAVEVPVVVPAQVEADVRRVLGQVGSLNGTVRDVIVLGESGGLRGYLARGEFADPDGGGAFTSCALSFNEITFHMGCVAGGGLEHIVDFGDDMTLGIVGTTDSAATVAEVTIDDVTLWSRVLEGTVNLVGHGSRDSQVDYTIYDAAGNVLDQGNLWNDQRASNLDGSEPTTTALAAPCSGSDIAPSALALSSIPQPVAETLGEIVDAARQCDFDRLEQVAGDNFTASYGGSEPSELWTQQEENGDKPMYWLLSILDLPGGTIDTDNGPMYVWPAAYAHQGSWETTPQQDMDALLSLYTQDDLQGFANFGGYYGYRVGITASGDWLFFVAGD